MIGTVNCVYETPCGWCSKWDKKCDRKQFKHELKNPLNSAYEDLKNSIYDAEAKEQYRRFTGAGCVSNVLL